MAKDPVCGMNVEPQKAAGTSEHNGSEYYFCNLACKKKFDEAPEKYLKTGKTERITLPVEGMSCGKCSARGKRGW